MEDKMNKVLEVKRKSGECARISLKKLDLSYIDQMIDLQQQVVEGLEDPQIYVASERNEFEAELNNGGVVLGFVTEENQLIAMGIYVEKGYDKHNYAYDLELEGEKVLRVGQIECTIVSAEFRGNRLQQILCEALEVISKVNGMEIICATASPYNEFSVNTFKKLGYEVKKDKLKYGGLRRYVLVKVLNKKII